MNLDPKNIGENIRKIRKESKCKYSQQRLAEILTDQYGITCSRQNISNIENGKGRLSIAFLIALTEIFHCDAGYLLGEINEKTYDIKEICDITTLSEAAVTNILSWKNGSSNYADTQNWTQIFSDIITHEKFNSLMECLDDCIFTSKLYVKVAKQIAISNNNVSDEIRNTEEELHNSYISKLWHISQMFNEIANNIINSQ